MKVSMRLGAYLLVGVIASACSSPIDSLPPVSPTVTPAATEGQPTAATEAVPPEPTASPGLPELPSIEIITGETLVFDASEQRCDARHIPDLPVRAIRDSGGQVVLFAGDIANRRMVGPTLEQLIHECEPVLDASYDPDPSHYDFEEWIGAVYTHDGQTVEALVHMEFHGERASDWYAERDFGGQQGAKGWYYNQRVGDSFQQMAFNVENNRWEGATEFCLISSRTAHPGPGCDSVRTWVSPLAGEATISGEVRDLDPYGGDGVQVEILHGDERIWNVTIENRGAAAIPEALVVTVEVGDALHFVVSAGETDSNDTTLFNPEINIGPHPCPSRDAGQCQMMAITHARSIDGGRTFEQSPFPDHVVAALPYRFEEGGEGWGLGYPSNVIRHPKDGYYYAAANAEEHGLQQGGTCMMRTDNPSDPRSWRAWDGLSFSIQYANPYLAELDPEAHVCQPVSLSEVWTLTSSLTYNEYLEAFILVGHAVDADPPGFYYALSRDLITWTLPTLLMEADLVQTTATPATYLAYPSLLDPQSPGLNFDLSGQSPYLFYSRFNDASTGDVDLVRVQLRFEK